MPFDLSLDLVVALFVAAAAGWLVAQFRLRDRTPRSPPPPPGPERTNGLRSQEPPRRLNEDYLKGLGFLLNEEPDKALEVFLRMVDVDNETVETHFALGSIYRRRGEVERAIRIHENIMARPSLSDEHRLEAMFALAEDYFRAGLFDRAEVSVSPARGERLRDACRHCATCCASTSSSATGIMRLRFTTS